MSAFKTIEKLRIPTFSSTEQAMEWGSHLNAEQHAKRDAALGEFDLQRMVDLATQSQLIREAADTFAPA
jgi:hypothetical protein